MITRLIIHSLHCWILLSTTMIISSEHCGGETHYEHLIWWSATSLILCVTSECGCVYKSHRIAIVAWTSPQINTFTAASFIVPYHTFFVPLSHFWVPNSLSPPLTTTLLWRIFCRQGVDVCMRGKLCLWYCPIYCSLTKRMFTQKITMETCVFFGRICLIWRFKFLHDR